MKFLERFKKSAMDPLLRALTDIKIRSIIKKYDMWQVYNPDKNIQDNLSTVFVAMERRALNAEKASASAHAAYQGIQNSLKHGPKLWRVYQQNRAKWIVRHAELQKANVKIKRLEKELEKLKNEKAADQT